MINENFSERFECSEEYIQFCVTLQKYCLRNAQNYFHFKKELGLRGTLCKLLPSICSTVLPSAASASASTTLLCEANRQTGQGGREADRLGYKTNSVPRVHFPSSSDRSQASSVLHAISRGHQHILTENIWPENGG